MGWGTGLGLGLLIRNCVLELVFKKGIGIAFVIGIDIWIGNNICTMNAIWMKIVTLVLGIGIGLVLGLELDFDWN